MKTKPRTVDKYTIISITMHLICVFIYNILDFRNLFSADCRCLFIFLATKAEQRNEKIAIPPTCVFISCISKIIIIVYSKSYMEIWCWCSLPHSLVCQMDRWIGVYIFSPMEITLIDMTVAFNQNDEIPFCDSIVQWRALLVPTHYLCVWAFFAIFRLTFLCLTVVLCSVCASMLAFFLSVLFNGFDLAKWLCFVLMFVCAFFSAALYLLSLAIGERKVHDMRVLTISIRIKYGPLINQLTRHESAD